MHSNSHPEITTLQYMGSKSRILKELCSCFSVFTDIDTIVDLFAGSGSVGYACKKDKNIISNDIEFYSYVINSAVLNGCLLTPKNECLFWEAVDRAFKIRASYFEELLSVEDNLLNGDDVDAYRKFVEDTPSIFNLETGSSCFLKLLELSKSIEVGNFKQNNIPFECLFVTYFANTYFGFKQCLEIDAMREQIEKLEDSHVRYVLMAATMAAMSIASSTTTHFAQYLKINGKSSFINLASKRRVSIFETVKDVLKEYRSAGLLNFVAENHKIYNLDFEECLKKISVNEKTLIYADPPYFKEHYSRYYHLLNTFCLYDYPLFSLNPLTKEFSVGRYRLERNVSDFGRKAKALKAFERLIACCAKSNAKLVISYSNNSIVKIDDILKAAKRCFAFVKTNEVDLKHSKQGRSSVSEVEEFIISCWNEE